MAETKKSGYQELLKHPNWQKKRLQILERDNFTCQDCCDTEKTLHVHHKIYINGKSPWEYENDLLITLCEDCHEYETFNLKEAEFGLIRAFKASPFLSSQWETIYIPISKLPKVHDPGVIATSLGWFLKQEENVRLVIDMYFKYLEDKSDGNF